MTSRGLFHDAGTDGIVAQPRAAGLVTLGTDAEGKETGSLPPEDVQMGRQLAMGDEATFSAILDAVEGRR